MLGEADSWFVDFIWDYFFPVFWSGKDALEEFNLFFHSRFRGLPICHSTLERTIKKAKMVFCDLSDCISAISRDICDNTSPTLFISPLLVSNFRLYNCLQPDNKLHLLTHLSQLLSTPCLIYFYSELVVLNNVWSKSFISP